MPRTLDEAAKELFDALAPNDLPQDFMVWPEPTNDCVMIGTAETAFTVRRKAIDEGVHIATARAALPHFIGAVLAASEARCPKPQPSAHIHIVSSQTDLSLVGRPPEPPMTCAVTVVSLGDALNSIKSQPSGARR